MLLDRGLWSCMGGRPRLGHCLRDWYRVLPQGIGNEGLCCQKTGGRVYTRGDREGWCGKVGFVGMRELPWRLSCFGSLGAWTVVSTLSDCVVLDGVWRERRPSILCGCMKSVRVGG